MENIFRDFYNQLPNEIRDMVDSLGIASFEDILAMGVLMGMDINKLQKSFEDGSMASGSVKFEDLLADDRSNTISNLLMGVGDNDSYPDEYSVQDGDDNPFAFPENRQRFVQVADLLLQGARCFRPSTA